jgi:hypothetical protein
MSTLADVSRIPCGASWPGRKEGSDLTEVVEIPKDIITFLRQNPEVAQKTTAIWEKISHFTDLDTLQHIYEDWQSFAGTHCVSSLQVLINAITNSLRDRDSIKQISQNIEALISPADEHCDDEENDELEFNQYLIFSMFFGFLNDSIGNILQISDAGSSGTYSFQPWFRPFLSRKGAAELLASQCRTSWLVRVTDIPGRFALHLRFVSDQKSTVYVSYIKFNPGQSEGKLSVEINGSIRSVADWPTLLYNVLQLDSRECVPIEAVDSEVVVDAGTVRDMVNSRSGEENGYSRNNMTGVQESLPIPLPLSRRHVFAK